MKKYCEKFDVYYDGNTGKYLEKKCNDKECDYCKDRPKKLIDACKKCNWEEIDNSICVGLK